MKRSGKLRMSCFQKACLLIPNSLAAAAWFQSQTRRASNSCDLVSSSCLSSRSSQVSFTTHFPAKSARPSATSHGIVASIASATAFSSIARRSNAILNSMPATSGDALYIPTANSDAARPHLIVFVLDEHQEYEVGGLHGGRDFERLLLLELVFQFMFGREVRLT